jgi:hypothetical protein
LDGAAELRELWGDVMLIEILTAVQLHTTQSASAPGTASGPGSAGAGSAVVSISGSPGISQVVVGASAPGQTSTSSTVVTASGHAGQTASGSKVVIVKGTHSASSTSTRYPN